MLTGRRSMQDSNRYHVLADSMGMLPTERRTRYRCKRLRIRRYDHLVYDQLVLHATCCPCATYQTRVVDALPTCPQRRACLLDLQLADDHRDINLAVLHAEQQRPPHLPRHAVGWSDILHCLRLRPNHLRSCLTGSAPSRGRQIRSWPSEG